MKNSISEKQQNILEAAISLLKVNTYDNVSIKDICKEAGISVSTFYYHFNSKDDIMKYLNSVNITLPKTIISKVFEASSYWEQLWTIHSSFANRITSYGYKLQSEIYKVKLIDEEGYIYDEDYKYMQDLIIPIIRKAQDAGEIKNTFDAETLALVVTKLMTGVIFTWCVDKNDYSLDEALKTSLECLYDVKPELRMNYSLD